MPTPKAPITKNVTGRASATVSSFDRTRYLTAYLAIRPSSRLVISSPVTGPGK